MSTRDRDEQAEQERQRQEQERMEQEQRNTVPRAMHIAGDDETTTNPVIVNH